MRIEAQVLKKKKFKTQGRKVYLTLKKKCQNSYHNRSSAFLSLLAK
jgi:hypothetical protein